MKTLGSSGAICFFGAAVLVICLEVGAYAQPDHGTGYLPMRPPRNAKVFQASRKLAGGQLPPKVDLRPFMTEVENQRETMSCVANAVVGAYEYYAKRETGIRYDASRLFVYYNARCRAQRCTGDEGSFIFHAIKSLEEIGACSEKLWPFDKSRVDDMPTSACYQQAELFKIKESNRVPTDIVAWKKALAEGLPVVFGVMTYNSFPPDLPNTGLISIPTPDEMESSEPGPHAMLAVGYSDPDQTFIVRNSWGAAWGDRGYCYVPYDYIMHPGLQGGDTWIFIPETPVTDLDKAWIFDDKPLIEGGSGFEFWRNQYGFEAYEKYADFWEGVYETYTEVIGSDYEKLLEMKGGKYLDWERKYLDN